MFTCNHDCTILWSWFLVVYIHIKDICKEKINIAMRPAMGFPASFCLPVGNASSSKYRDGWMPEQST